MRKWLPKLCSIQLDRLSLYIRAMMPCHVSVPIKGTPGGSPHRFMYPMDSASWYLVEFEFQNKRLSSLTVPVSYMSGSWHLVGGVTRRTETMPRTNVLRPLVPKSVPCDTMSLDWYIPAIMDHTIRLGWYKMTGMYQCRDIVFPGWFI